MNKRTKVSWIAGLTILFLSLTAALAAPLNCDVSDYTPVDGLTADVTDETLVLTWTGSGDENVRMTLVNNEGIPLIRELAVQRAGGDWVTVATDSEFEFSIVEGYRRITNQQLEPLVELGYELTPEVIDQYKWDAFWDAPLNMQEEGSGLVEGLAGQPGLPRSPDEIRRGILQMNADSCTVTTDGTRLRIVFPGATLGTFSGDLVVTVFKGTNLIQSEIEASTQADSVAYKYDAGINGLDGTVVVWNDIANARQELNLQHTPNNEDRVLLRAANRIIAAELDDASIAAFPPPHVWYWAREVEVNLGNNYYRKDSDDSLAIGIGQAEQEIDRFLGNWALYSAPPGTTQHMRAYFYPTLGDADAAINGALAFTNGDVYPAVEGYKIMSAHYHLDAGTQWMTNGLDFHIDTFDALRSAGINIVALAETNREPELARNYFSLKGAARHSDEDLLILPNLEETTIVGGHWNVWLSHPVLYDTLPEPRTADQPLKVEHPEYGTYYQLGSPEDVMAMVEAENLLIYMPHPRTKGSTGYPDAIKDTPYFQNDRYRGVGWRWGMGADLSEIRMSEKRVLDLLDDMNNWAAQGGYKPKYLVAITETWGKQPGDDIYGNGPITYIKLDEIPTGTDYSSIINAMMAGDYFMSTGEVRFNSYGLEGSGADAVYKADIVWTFPLDFVEVVWGDGNNTYTEIVSASDTGAFGQRTFEVPVDLSQAKWVRFAAWDVAGNGALTNPVALDGR